MIEEIWKDIEGYEKSYKVSNYGRVKSLDRNITYSNGRICNHKGKILSPMLSNNGYLYVHLLENTKRVKYSVHRLVAETFIKNDENKLEVNHKNGLKLDNRLKNLEWSTRQENVDHSYKIGLCNQTGSNNTAAKLSKKDILKIKWALKYLNIKQREISEIFNISESQISKIKYEKNWKNIIVL